VLLLGLPETFLVRQFAYVQVKPEYRTPTYLYNDKLGLKY